MQGYFLPVKGIK